jgi:choline dehydrogenase
MFADAV